MLERSTQRNGIEVIEGEEELVASRLYPVGSDLFLPTIQEEENDPRELYRMPTDLESQCSEIIKGKGRSKIRLVHKVKKRTGTVESNAGQEQLSAGFELQHCLTDEQSGDEEDQVCEEGTGQVLDPEFPTATWEDFSPKPEFLESCAVDDDGFPNFGATMEMETSQASIDSSSMDLFPQVKRANHGFAAVKFPTTKQTVSIASGMLCHGDMIGVDLSRTRETNGIDQRDLVTGRPVKKIVSNGDGVRDKQDSTTPREFERDDMSVESSGLQNFDSVFRDSSQERRSSTATDKRSNQKITQPRNPNTNYFKSPSPVIEQPRALTVCFRPRSNEEYFFGDKGEMTCAYGKTNSESSTQTGNRRTNVAAQITRLMPGTCANNGPARRVPRSNGTTMLSPSLSRSSGRNAVEPRAKVASHGAAMVDTDGFPITPQEQDHNSDQDDPEELEPGRIRSKGSRSSCDADESKIAPSKKLVPGLESDNFISMGTDFSNVVTRQPDLSHTKKTATEPYFTADTRIPDSYHANDSQKSSSLTGNSFARESDTILPAPSGEQDPLVLFDDNLSSYKQRESARNSSQEDSFRPIVNTSRQGEVSRFQITVEKNVPTPGNESIVSVRKVKISPTQSPTGINSTFLDSDSPNSRLNGSFEMSAATTPSFANTFESSSSANEKANTTESSTARAASNPSHTVSEEYLSRATAKVESYSQWDAKNDDESQGGLRLEQWETFNKLSKESSHQPDEKKDDNSHSGSSARPKREHQEIESTGQETGDLASKQSKTLNKQETKKAPPVLGFDPRAKREKKKVAKKLPEPKMQKKQQGDKPQSSFPQAPTNVIASKSQTQPSQESIKAASPTGPHYMGRGSSSEGQRKLKSPEEVRSLGGPRVKDKVAQQSRKTQGASNLEIKAAPKKRNSSSRGLAEPKKKDSLRKLVAKNLGFGGKVKRTTSESKAIVATTEESIAPNDVLEVRVTTIEKSNVPNNVPEAPKVNTKSSIVNDKQTLAESKTIVTTTEQINVTNVVPEAPKMKPQSSRLKKMVSWRLGSLKKKGGKNAQPAADDEDKMSDSDSVKDVSVASSVSSTLGPAELLEEVHYFYKQVGSDLMEEARELYDSTSNLLMDDGSEGQEDPEETTSDEESEKRSSIASSFSDSPKLADELLQEVSLFYDQVGSDLMEEARDIYNSFG